MHSSLESTAFRHAPTKVRLTTKDSIHHNRSAQMSVLESFGGRALARKVIRMGYYWANDLRDANEFARKCVKC